MSRPDVATLTEQLLDFIKDEKIAVNPEFTAEMEKSGVYAVINAVFSSMAVFAGVVSAMKNFGENSGLRDVPELKFSDYLKCVRGDSEVPTKERFDEVAAKIFCNKGVIAGRRKVEVAYDVCQRFVKHDLETHKDVQALPKGIPFTCEHPGTPGDLEKLVIGGIAGYPGYNSPTYDLPNLKVRGIGLALGAYMLIRLGDESFIKLDTQLLKLMGRIGGWSPKMGNVEDFQLVRQAVSCAAEQLKVTPASLYNALWAWESDRSAKKAQ